jgi:hypothetical protein
MPRPDPAANANIWHLRGWAAPSSAKHAYILLALIWGLCTLVVFAFRSGYCFPPCGLLDSWYYTAYKWDLGGQIKEFGPTYYGSRLSWILPGALLYKSLPLVVADLSDKLLWSAIFSLSAGVVVLDRAKPAAAYLAIAISVFSAQVVSAIHTDYTDIPVFTCAAAHLACIVLARESKHWPVLIGVGGVFFAGMAIANLSALSSVGAGIAVFHLFWLRWNLRRQVACIALYLLAAAAVCGVLALANHAAGGPYNFLQPQLDMLVYMKNLKANPWMPKDRLWFTEATWLVVPVVAFLWGLYKGILSPAKDPRMRQLTWALTVGLAISLAGATYMHLRALNATLNTSYYTTFHLAFALPLLACLTCASTPSWPRLAACITMLAAVSFCWTSGAINQLLWQRLPFLHSAPSVPLFLLLALLAAAVIVDWLMRIGRWGRPAHIFGHPEILLLGIFFAATPNGYNADTDHDRLSERFVAIKSAFDVLAKEFPRGSVRYWVHPECTDGASLASTKLWGFSLFSLNKFPDYELANLQSLTARQTAVIPALPGHGPETLQTAALALSRAKFTVTKSRIIPIPGDNGIGFDLVCLSIREQVLDPETEPDSAKWATPLMSLQDSPSTSYLDGLAHNLYGARRGAVIDRSSGHAVFTRTDPRDHLATPYLALRPLSPARPRLMTIVGAMPTAGQCTAIVQIDGYRTIAQIDFSEPGRTVHTITVPPEAAEIRIYLQSDSDAPTALPTKILLYELTTRPKSP